MRKLWNLLCSLKVAIALASAATLTIMLGSLWIPGNPQLFGQLDALILGSWLQGPGAQRLALSWWVYLACILIVLFGINTLCCFIDWLRNIRSRWRKTGEYLLHLGFCLALVAYMWGSFDGARTEQLALPLDATRTIPAAPGYYLTLESFDPQIDASGRPIDFPQQLTLKHADQIVTSQQVRLNHPLLWKDMVVIPSSFQQQVVGFHMLASQGDRMTWRPGEAHALDRETTVRILEFFPNVIRRDHDRVQPMGNQLGNPAFLLQLERDGEPPWKGWYLLREPPPTILKEAGILLRPLSPATVPISVLTISIDPGAPLAAAGGILMGLGAILAMISYYAKRQRGEHPDIP